MGYAVAGAPIVGGVGTSVPDRLHRATYWLLWALVFTVPWQKLVLVDGIGTITRLIGIVAAGVAAMAIVSEGRRQQLVDAHILMFLLTSWVIASAIWTVRPDITYATAFGVIQVVVLAWMVEEFADDPRRLHGIMWAYVLGAALTAAITILQYQLNPTGARRFSASEDTHPNGIAFMMCMAVPMAWYLSLKLRSSRLLPVLWLTVPLIVVAILLTASRSALLLLAVALLIIPLTWDRLTPTLKRWCLLGGVVALALIPSFVPDRPLDRLAQIGEGLGGEALNARWTLMDAAWTIVGQRPVLGVGAGASRFEIASLTGMQQGAHNAYLSVATELGFVGLGLFALLLLSIGLRLLSTRGLERQLSIVLGVTLILGLVPRHWEFDKATWLVLALLLALGLRQMESVEEQAHRRDVLTPPVWAQRRGLPPANRSTSGARSRARPEFPGASRQEAGMR